MSNRFYEPGRVITADKEEFYRADGNMVCDMCGKSYYQHPHSEHRGYDGEPFLRRLCNGDAVKL